MFDICIHNGTILTMDNDFRIIPSGIVTIRNGTIEHVEAQQPDRPLPAARQQVDARGGIIMPGLINSHTHLPMSLFRGLADDLPLEQWLQERMFPVEARFITAPNVPQAVRLACAEMLLGGITTCCDGYFFADQIAETVSAIGLRAVLAQGVIDFPAPGVPDPLKNIATARSFIDRWSGRYALIQPSIFCHALYTCSAETLSAARQVADEAGVLFQIHVAETRTEVKNCQETHGCSPVAYLDKLGILNSNTLLIHGVWLDGQDIERIARSGAAVVHCPESNMKLASGIAPVTELIAAGVQVGLGTDSCASNNDLNIFGEMDTAAKLHKVARMDPSVMDAATILKMATCMGARAIGLENRIGSLVPGKEADLIIVDLKQPHLTPIYHPTSHLVYAAKASDVRDVMVAGRWVVLDKTLLTMDLEKTLDEVNTIAAEIRGTLP